MITITLYTYFINLLASTGDAVAILRILSVLTLVIFVVVGTFFLLNHVNGEDHKSLNDDHYPKDELELYSMTTVSILSLILTSFLYHIISHMLQFNLDLRRVYKASKFINESIANAKNDLENPRENDFYFHIPASSYSNTTSNVSQTVINLSSYQVHPSTSNKEQKFFRTRNKILKKLFFRKQYEENRRKKALYPKWFQGESDFSNLLLLEKSKSTRIVRLPAALTFFDGLQKRTDGSSTIYDKTYGKRMDDEAEVTLSEVGGFAVASESKVEDEIELIDVDDFCRLLLR